MPVVGCGHGRHIRSARIPEDSRIGSSTGRSMRQTARFLPCAMQAARGVN